MGRFWFVCLRYFPLNFCSFAVAFLAHPTVQLTERFFFCLMAAWLNEDRCQELNPSSRQQKNSFAFVAQERYLSKTVTIVMMSTAQKQKKCVFSGFFLISIRISFAFFLSHIVLPAFCAISPKSYFLIWRRCFPSRFHRSLRLVHKLLLLGFHLFRVCMQMVVFWPCCMFVTMF